MLSHCHLKIVNSILFVVMASYYIWLIFPNLKKLSGLARVTKINGYLYTVFGVYGGFLEDCIIPAARNYYNENADFKRLIDNISPEDFDQIFDLIEKVSLEFNISLPIAKQKFQQLFDVDFIVMLQNLLQPQFA